MAQLEAGTIDCDIHPSLPGLRSLFPYLEAPWADMIAERGIYELDSSAYPANAPLTARADWRPPSGKAASDLDAVRRQVLDPFGMDLAICNCLYGVQLLFSEDMAVAIARALNDWMVREWLDREPRLRASIVVPVQNPEKAAEEIDRCAGDRRFVQVLMLVMDQMPLGKRFYWPIYEAAQRHGLPVGIHAGSAYRHPVTAVGWPSYYSEDYAAQAQAFQSQLTSLICEGVFAKFPDLRVVLMESGVTWLPSHEWRLTKFWHGLRSEIPWVNRSPGEIIRSNVRFTLQPFDAPDDPHELERVLDHLESDDLILFSTDYPHWQFDGDSVLPEGLSPALAHKFSVVNPRATYPRLTEVINVNADA